MILVLSIFAAGSAVAAKSECATIKDGTIFDTNGNLVETGYDLWGYNYQAHMFNGFFGNFSRPAVPVTEGATLQMKWSDAWLSNRDCDGDTSLDRGAGTDTPGTSQGWLTNHQKGEYENVEGKMCHYTYFVKIVYNPDSCNAANVIWGSYCIIEEVSNDQCGEHGRVKDNLVNPAGLGYYTN
jgi:hypothetical protein